MAVPSKIKCTRCYITKGPIDFSNRQLEQLEQLERLLRIKSFDPVFKTFIKCRMCADTRQYSKQCDDCEEKKSVDAFTRVQRKLDNGKCRRCMDERVNPESYEPDLETAAAKFRDEEEGGGSGDEGELGTKSSIGGASVV